jgi:arylsulfatase A-like enzyme
LVLSRLPAVDESRRRSLPNILLISIDTLRKSEVTLYNPSLPTMPALAARRPELIRFDQAITQAPWTRPSHLALFYGRRPPVRYWEWEVLSLPQVLEHYGYATASFNDGGWMGRGGGMDVGFEHLTSTGYHESLDVRLDQVGAWLDETGGAPCFAFVHTYHVHLPYDPEPEYVVPFHAAEYTGPFTGDTTQLLEHNQHVLAEGESAVTPQDVAYLRALYRAELLEVDGFLERLFSELERRGYWDDMLVVLFSDHGESFFERGFFDHGTVLYDELINVPLVVKLPAGLEAKASVVDRQVELLDVAPTILDLIGLPAPEGIEGESFASLLARGGFPPYEKTHAISAVATTRNYGAAKQAVRTAEWKYILHPKSGTEELYHLTRDPAETRNVAAKHPEVTKLLRVHLQDPAAIEQLESPEAPQVGDDDLEVLKALGYIE